MIRRALFVSRINLSGSKRIEVALGVTTPGFPTIISKRDLRSAALSHSAQTYLQREIGSDKIEFAVSSAILSTSDGPAGISGVFFCRALLISCILSSRITRTSLPYTFPRTVYSIPPQAIAISLDSPAQQNILLYTATLSRLE